MKNVIFLSIDALSQTRLKNQNHMSHRAPNLKYLSERGICCTNAFSNGQPTQMAFPAILSSTLPLDCNGYDRGVRNRKVTLAEVMKNNDFHTAGFSTLNFTGRYYSYDRGFNELYELYSIRRFWNSMYKNFFSHFIDLYTRDLIDFDEFCNMVAPSLIDAFEYLTWFAKDKEKEIKDKRIRYNPIVHGYNFKKMYNSASNELERIRKDPKTCLSRWGEIPLQFTALINSAKYGEGFFGKVSAYVDQLMEDIMIKGQDKLGFSYPYSIKRYDHFVSAEYLKDCIVNWIEQNDNNPFFLWAHFLDIHEGNYTSGRFQIPPIFAPSMEERLWMKRSDLKRYHTERATNLALNYVDKQIGDILEYLKRKKLLEETLVVITSDHGMEEEKILRHGHKATLFYDEYVRIPLIFYNPNLEQRQIDRLCSHLDVAPTITDLMGISSVSEFEGVCVYGNETRRSKYVIIENAGRGPCDLKRKKINIGLRTTRFKYIWKEAMTITQNELYDLERDPKEMTNVINDSVYREVIDDLNRVALSRCKEIRDREC